jgi:CubicO group peptidase (beta-lactamase class C family)
VTLGQLMHHVSGTPEYMRLLEARGFTFPFEEKISCELELKVISEVEFLNFKPGSMWQYSNSNYLLLGTVVEKVSGQQLAEFLQRNIFGPLQLHMVVGSVSVRPGKARSYRVSSGTSGYEIADWHVDALGAGVIQSTPGTLVRWADNYRSGRLGGSQLLEAQLRGAEPTSEDVIGHEGTRYGAGIVSDSDGTLWHGGE